MATKSFVRTRPGQRVDQPDFEHAVDQTPRDVLEQIGQHVLTGSDTSNPYVLEGFATTVVGTTITVTNGVALMNYRDRGVLRRGSIMSDGPTSRSIDIASYGGSPATTYNVYVCLSLEDGDFGNRPYWDNVGGVEETRNVATRRADNWSIAVETQSPGDEWMLIASVLKTGATVDTLTDLRQFYFEGSPAQTHQVTDNEWGTSNDRNNTRATYGVKSFRKFVRGVQRQIQSIIGTASPGGWWSAVPAGADLTSLLANKLARNGSQTMTGNLLPDADNTRDIGAAGTRWNEIFSNSGIFSVLAAYQYLDFLNTNPASGNTEGRHLLIAARAAGASPNQEYRNVYQSQNSAIYGSSPALEVAINAEWFEQTAGVWRWRSYNNAAASYLYGFSRSGLYIAYKSPAVSLWTDANWATITSVDSTTANFAALTNTNVSTLSADRCVILNDAPATPTAKTVYANTLVVARGTVSGNGAGAYTLGSGFNAGVNYSATAQGAGVRITLSTGVAASGNYQVLITGDTQDVVLTVDHTTKTATVFDVFAFVASTGNALHLNTGGIPVAFDFIVVGG